MRNDRADIEASRGQMSERIDDAIDTLPVEHATIIRLSFFDGWTQAEIAQSSGCCQKTISNRIRAALVMLRKELSD
jgi:RNA polymerase sigma factor (sigma-70 family)